MTHTLGIQRRVTFINARQDLLTVFHAVHSLQVSKEMHTSVSKNGRCALGILCAYIPEDVQMICIDCPLRAQGGDTAF